MPNATTPTELNTILQTLVKPNYPGANTDNYYVTSTLLPTIPSTGAPDRILQYLTELILYLRNPASFGYAAPMSDADKLDLYEDIQRIMGDTIDNLNLIKSAVDDVVTALSL